MTKISPVGAALKHTPFTKEIGKRFFINSGIEFTEPAKADLIITGTFKKLLIYMLRFGQSKKYLIWTKEPRFNTHFKPKVTYPLLPKFHVMNVYTGIHINNYHYFYFGYDNDNLKYSRIPKFNSKKIVSLMTYQAGPKWQLKYKGDDIDLCNLRTKIALEAHKRGNMDIYGRGWPDNISIEDSREDGVWRHKKMEILKNYHFNLCFENTNFPNYCTEKIWDSISGECLPIYYGRGNNIYNDFPQNSFLDYCEFNDINKLLKYIQNMSINEFNDRMELCVQTFNNVIKQKSESDPDQLLFKKTLNKINKISK